MKGDNSMIKKLLKPLGLSLAALLLLNSVLFLDLTGGMATIADAATPVNDTGAGANLVANGNFDAALTTDQIVYGSGTQIVTEEDGNRCLELPAADGPADSSDNVFAFRQIIRGLDTSKTYYLAYRIKSEHTNAGWSLFAGLHQTAPTPIETLPRDWWKHIKPLTTNAVNGGLGIAWRNDYGEILTDFTTTEWQMVVETFTPTVAVLSLTVIQNYPNLGKVWIDDIIVAEQTPDLSLIENGDFEAGFMKGFIARPKTDSTPTYGTARLVDAASVGGNGNYSLYLPDQTYLYQFVDGLTIGKTYVFSFNIRYKDYSTVESWATFAAVHKGSQNLTLGANPNGTPFSDVTRSASDGINYTTNDSYGGIVWTPRTLGSTSWYTVRQEFVADDTTAKLYIFNYNSDPGLLVQCYIDDIALVEKTDDFIMDGGFESGTLDGVVDTNAYLVPADSVGGNGNYVLYLPTVDNDNPSEAWQMITGLTPGRNYTLSYRMKWGATGDYAWYAFADIYSTRRQRLKNPNYGGAIAGKETLVPTGGLIFILDSRYNGTIVHRITSTAWQTVTIQFTATTTSVYLSFFHYINTIQDLYIDDISMTEDPEIIDDAIVKNGSFETGNLYKWTNSGAGSAASVVRDPVDASNNCLKIAATGASYADLYVQQKIEGLTPDQLYIMTFRMRLDEIQSEYDWGAFLGISVRQLDFSTTLKGNVEPPYILYRGLNLSGRTIGSDATGLLMINKFSDTQWREYSIIFTPGQDHAYVYFSNYYKKCDLYVDDIVISEYEEIAEEKLVDVDFEDELELVTGHNSSDLWSKSSDKAHSGQYSAKYQGRYAEEWIRLEATDRYGSLIGKVKLEPNTTYRFSYWMLATGTYNHPPVARFAVWGTGFETTEYQYSFCSAYNQWEYKTIIFTTDAVTTDMSFHMAGCYMQRDITIYIDDICLEKIGSMIIEENITGLYCEDYFNQIPSGNFEGNLSSTVWNQASNSFRQVTNNQLGVAAGGYSYLQIDGNVDFTHPITINGGKKYNFAFSYLAEKNTDLQIGLVNSDGTLIPPMENSGISIGSLMTAGNTNGKWQRVGYTFLSPADGAVKLVIRGTGVKINLDEIQLFLTKLAWDENPNEYDEFDKDDQHDESDEEESKGSSSTDTEPPSTGERTIALWALILLAVTTGVVTRHLSQKSISRKGRGKS
jgi:hypothetical protein